MLTVKTYLDRSEVHGIGLFAGVDIPAGRLVWVFNDLIDIELSVEDWLAMGKKISPQAWAELRKYSYKENNKIYICYDNAQFMNHSAGCWNVGNDRETNTMNARTDIRKGEELICNYFEFCDADDWNIVAIGKNGQGTESDLISSCLHTSV